MSSQGGFIFYPHDWLTDDKLSLCSMATKGAWIDLICWMHQSKRRGFLVVNGISLNKDDIRSMLKLSKEEFDAVWNELNKYGVISQHKDGTFYSKRVVQDAEKQIPQSGLSREELQLIDDVIKEFDRVVNDKISYDLKEARDLIAIRIKKDKATLSDFSKVIKLKYADWWGNDVMEMYVRPYTLFGNKFTRYLHEAKSKNIAPIHSTSKVPDFGGYQDL